MRLRRPAYFDLVLGLGVLGLGLAELATGQLDGPAWVATAAVVVNAVAPMLRRTSLWLALIVGFSTIVVSYRLGLSQQDFMASIIVGLYLAFRAGYELAGRESVLAFVFGYVCVVSTDSISVGNLGWLLLVIGGAWSAGRALQNRRLLIDELHATRDELAQRAVAEERLRIAQDLHDVVAHAVTVMLVQATAAERLVRTDPDAAEAAARSVQESGREATAELRQLLSVLRVTETDSAPQPGLAEIEALVNHFREAGMRVDYSGCTSAVPPGIALAAYRVAQEALTNVLRHSAARAARLLVSADGHRLRVEVSDPGPALPGAAEGGHGLVGMRERVAACGGELVAGPEAGGFRVRASLPLGAAP